MNQKNASKRSPATRRKIRRALIAVFILALLGLAIRAFIPEPLAVDVVEVRRGSLRVTVDEDGMTRVKDRYTISAPLAGSLARLELEAGDMVHEGDVIARILPSAVPLLDSRSKAELDARVSSTTAGIRQAEASVERARATADLAESERDRFRSLAATGAATSQQLERLEVDLRARREDLASAEFGVRVARHEQTMARAAAGRVTRSGVEESAFEVRSPVSGRVLRVFRTSDGPVTPGTDLIEVGDPAALELVVDVLTSDAVRVRPGARVEIDRWGGDEKLEARVRLVEPSAFTRVSALGVDEQRVNVVLDLISEHERWSSLGDGYRIEAAIVVDEAQGVPIVPELAIIRAASGPVVFELVDGVAKRRELALGRRNGIDAEVRSGIAAGARVVLHPSEQIAEGTSVRAR